LQVFPDIGLGGGIAEEIGRMVGGHEFAAAPILPFAAVLGDAAIGLEKGFGGASAEANYHFGIDYVELAKEEGRTGLDFVGLGGAIFRGAALNDVADVHVFALQAHSFDHLRKKFSSAADERKALKVFIGAGTFTNEDKLSMGIAVAEDEFVATFVELAAGTFAEVFADFQEGVAGDFFFEERKSGGGSDGCRRGRRSGRHVFWPRQDGLLCSRTR